MFNCITIVLPFPLPCEEVVMKHVSVMGPQMPDRSLSQFSIVNIIIRVVSGLACLFSQNFGGWKAFLVLDEHLLRLLASIEYDNNE